MLLRDMMKRIRFLFGSIVLILGLMAINAHAQSTYQYIGFSVQAEFEVVTNDVPSDPTFIDDNLRLILVTSSNVVKSIAADQFGTPAWTNWANAGIVRRVNLVTGEERIYLSRTDAAGGTTNVDVSSYFSGSYLNNFTSGTSNAFPAATNNFTENNPNPYPPLFRGQPTNHFSSAGLYFISLNTTNLKMNLLGANFAFLGNGLITKYSGVEHGTNYSGAVQNEIISVVGSLSWTRSTNIFDLYTQTTNTFYSGPARGTVTVREPNFSPVALPPAPDP
jgi:hypothetical protein